MRIAIPVEGNTLESPVCLSFGRTETFLLVDPETLETEVKANSAAQAQGGAGIVAAQALLDSGVQGVIAMHCGKNAADVLTAAGIPLYRGVGGTAAEAVAQFKAGELKLLEDIHPGYHQHGQ